MTRGKVGRECGNRGDNSVYSRCPSPTGPRRSRSFYITDVQNGWYSTGRTSGTANSATGEDLSESRRIVKSGAQPREVAASAAVERLATGDSLVALAEELAAAMIARDGAAIHRLLADPQCARLPRDVREEAMAFSALPEKSTRAPMRTLVHLHRMREIERAGEAVPAEQIELFASGAGTDRRHVRLSRDG